MPMLSFRISEELAARVDGAAAGNRSAWIKAALEQALGETGSAESAAAAGTSAPSRASSDVGLPPTDRVAAFRRADLLRRAGN